MRQAAAFVALTFALSWGALGVAILTDSDAVDWRVTGTFGPTVAALGLDLRACFDGGGEGRGALDPHRSGRCAGLARGPCASARAGRVSQGTHFHRCKREDRLARLPAAAALKRTDGRGASEHRAGDRLGALATAALGHAW